ncbi:unnamed protein product [Ilex paraguariensis]|uniref:Cytochrome P450 n=1 Tax=Ilex paraguariensis TaxID=185542 RepID=A0ABC8QWZ8_9AQUA
METTALSASWCLMLLAAHPEWLSCALTEVLDVCSNNLPDAEMLRSMKTLNMVIQEAPDLNVKGIQVPKGINIHVPIPVLHQHPDLWGADVHRFNPERFTQGTTGACKFPQAYMPFGVGTRICAGQHFAMAELKVILSLVLSRSPAYRHSPVFRLVIEPEHGVYLHFRRV